MIRRFRPFMGIKKGGVLDYSTFEIIYSIARQVNPDYSGSLIRIRRDSDSTEQDIGIVDGELDLATISSFCSGTTGRIQTVYNQGTEGADFNVTYRRGTRSIIYQSGAVELVNGKPAMLGQTDNEYWTGLLDIADTVFGQHKYHSSVLETGSVVQNAWLCGEAGTATGNNFKAQFASTDTIRNLISNVVTSASISMNHLLLVQATLNQQRQYSFIDFDTGVSVDQSESYWNKVLQAQRNHALGWGSNTQFRMHLMRVSVFVFTGRFQEFSLKTWDGEAFNRTQLNLLENEQNDFYGIY